MPLVSRGIVRNVAGAQVVTDCLIDLDTDYPPNGYPLDPIKDLGAAMLNVVRVDAPPRLGYHFEYDYTLKTLRVYLSGGAGAVMQEVAAHVDLSALVSIRLRAIGF